MNFEQLPVGSTFTFGEVADSRIGPRTFVWTKVDEACHAVLRPGQLKFLFDHPETDSPYQNRKYNGWNYYPLSNVHQFLNSRIMRGWFSPSHEKDFLRGYYIASEPYNRGFLANFTTGELRCMRPMRYQVVAPKGSVKQFGKAVQFESLVTLPSLSQACEYGPDDIPQEGDRIPLLSDGRVFCGWTRTGAGDSHLSYVRDRYGLAFHGSSCSNTAALCPIILLDPEMEMFSTSPREPVPFVAKPSAEGPLSDETMNTILFE